MLLIFISYQQYISSVHFYIHSSTSSYRYPNSKISHYSEINRFLQQKIIKTNLLNSIHQSYYNIFQICLLFMIKICSQCYYISGIKIQQCLDCSQKYFINDEDATPKPIKKKKIIDLELLKKKQELFQKKKKQAEERRSKKIQQRLRKKTKNLNQFYIPSQQLIKMDRNTQQQQKILQNLIQNSFKSCLGHFYKKYEGSLQMKNYGPTQVIKNPPVFSYSTTPGYTAIPIKTQTQKCFQTQRENRQWIVAYHGTSLIATQSIIKQGFKPGSGQCYATYKNLNPISPAGLDVGRGIYCSPTISVAEGYNKSMKYMCILKCRVNPMKLKIGAQGIWVLNDKQDIIPYKLLIKKKYGW